MKNKSITVLVFILAGLASVCTPSATEAAVLQSFDQLFLGDDASESFEFNLPHDPAVPTTLRFSGFLENRHTNAGGAVRFFLGWQTNSSVSSDGVTTGSIIFPPWPDYLHGVRMPAADAASGPMRVPVEFQAEINFSPGWVKLAVEGLTGDDNFRFVGDFTIEPRPLLRDALDPLIAAAQCVTLVPAGSVWKYHDQGANLGTSWAQAGYDDSQWASGRAQLGYGEGDEATVVESGPGGTRHITTYFRHTFTVTNASSCTNLTLRLLRDDGAVVYLNGVELVRVGIPPGPVNYQTLAVNAAAEGSLFITPLLNPTILLDGTNVLAVEIHQVSVSSSDISFDLELVNDEAPALAAFLDLGNNAVFTAPARLSLSAKAATPGGVNNLKFYINNSEVDQRSMQSRLYATFNRDFTTPSNCSLAISAHDNRGFSKTSVVNIVIVPPPSETTMLTSAGAQWKFLDDGSAPSADWRSLSYNDENWNAGPATLGYGKSGLGTAVRSNRADGTRITTTYFRRSWAVPDPARFSRLALRVLGDDGAKVFLNGTEVFRNNLPSEPVGASTLALEMRDPVVFTSGSLIDASLLLPGTNVLAVEVHQASAGARDLIFDMELTGLIDPRLTIQFALPDSVRLTWPAPSTGYRLISAPGLAPLEWSDVTNAPAPVGGNMQVILPRSGGGRFYRLIQGNE